MPTAPLNFAITTHRHYYWRLTKLSRSLVSGSGHNFPASPPSVNLVHRDTPLIAICARLFHGLLRISTPTSLIPWGLISRNIPHGRPHSLVLGGDIFNGHVALSVAATCAPSLSHGFWWGNCTSASREAEASWGLCGGPMRYKNHTHQVCDSKAGRICPLAAPRQCMVIQTWRRDRTGDGTLLLTPT